MDLDVNYRRGSCAQDLSWDASRYIHIVRRGGLDTLCGASASTPDIWTLRGSGRKPDCQTCIERAVVPQHPELMDQDRLSEALERAQAQLAKCEHSGWATTPVRTEDLKIILDNVGTHRDN